MRHLKRIIFTLLGIAFIIGPVYGMVFAMTHADKFEATIGNVIGMTFIGILLTFLICLIGALINKLFEDSGITIFTAFFMVSFQKRKKLYHSTMGQFELIIDEDDLEGILVKQGFFHYLNHWVSHHHSFRYGLFCKFYMINFCIFRPMSIKLFYKSTKFIRLIIVTNPFHIPISFSLSSRMSSNLLNSFASYQAPLVLPSVTA